MMVTLTNTWETHALPDKSPRQQERGHVLHLIKGVCQSPQTSTVGVDSTIRGPGTAKDATLSGRHATWVTDTQIGRDELELATHGHAKETRDPDIQTGRLITEFCTLGHDINV